MRYCLLILIFCFIYSSAYTQSIVDGYYITLDNDSIKAQIKVPKKIFSGVDVERLERKVKSVYGNSEGFEKFRPTEIKGFGFIYKNKEYNFVARPIKANRYKFFEQIFLGNKATVYYYRKTGSRGAKHETFIVTNANGEDVIFKNSMSRKKIRNKLSSLFKAPTSKQIIEEQSITKRHLESALEEIAKSINNS